MFRVVCPVLRSGLAAHAVHCWYSVLCVAVLPVCRFFVVLMLLVGNCMRSCSRRCCTQASAQESTAARRSVRTMRAAPHTRWANVPSTTTDPSTCTRANPASTSSTLPGTPTFTTTGTSSTTLHQPHRPVVEAIGKGRAPPRPSTTQRAGIGAPGNAWYPLVLRGTALSLGSAGAAAVGQPCLLAGVSTNTSPIPPNCFRLKEQ